MWTRAEGHLAQVTQNRADAVVVEQFETPPGQIPPPLPLDGFGVIGSTAEERRRRRRRPCRIPGWIYRGEQVSQVEMRNISSDGAGFVCENDLRKSERLHLKTGLGPTRRPRLAEVMFVRDRSDGRLDVGVRFIR